MRKLFTTLFFALLPCFVWAQVTTASITGAVTDSNNTPIAYASVVATHIATGTNYGTSTNIEGIYHLDGLKVGGEYVVTFSCIGYKNSTIDGIYPALGETLQLNSVLHDQPSIDNVVVVGDYKPHSNFSSYDIESMPTVSRSIYDIARLSPFVATQQEGGVAIGGANSRYNSFYIDGIVNNDMYGLTASGTNGGLASANPIPLDALEQIQVVVAPFDVRQSGFTGGGINAVTKSGTNTATATAYAYYTGNNLYGKGANNIPLAKQNALTYGASIGGAIVKNKLFYFVSAENSLDYSPSSYHVGDPNCKVAEQDVITIANHYKSLTGYDG
ncbi:MAG: carboxypeptidase regulatory-like domain-containing protein, partial [Alistipes sp.]|nr:carboxypeptidase regulatory-like domain-containing protein [Alistipes sp.]